MIAQRSAAIGCLLLLALAGCGSSTESATPGATATFWQDVAPIYNAKCVGCHQSGGIAPFPLDNYVDAKTHAEGELARVTQGTMPPYFMVHDGSCGSFHDESTLSDEQKSTIQSWITSGQLEGTPVTLTVPQRPRLSDAVDVQTPLFSPVAVGDQLAMFDEYRCFPLDAPNSSDAFLTGYEVTPGDATIVHHVLVFTVDPQKATSDGRTNAEIMQALDAELPDRLGWPCFGAAGEKIEVSGVPVAWAPGQGVVSYPDGMGFPVRTTDKLIVQVHYNLADPGSAGRIDQTTVHLRFKSSVDRQLAFLLPDAFLDSLGKVTPDVLPPKMPDAIYTWRMTGTDVGVTGIPSVDLVAVMPHMHGRGIRQHLRLGLGENLACASHLENWDFHWQEFYFYKTPPAITPDTQVEVTCEYDTRADAAPVLPGWGTRNEMCLTVMMIALPAQ